jgi:hypothetical protein
LRFDCTVTTDAASDVWMKFAPDTTGACDLLRTTPTSVNATTHSLTLYGMKPSQAYNWRAFAKPAAGGAQVQGSCNLDTTGALPAAGSDTANLGQLTATKWGTAQQVRAVVTHYGCALSGEDLVTDLVAVDSTGEVVWYQDVATDLGFEATYGYPFVMEAISLRRPENTITAVVNHEILVEYDLAGNLLTLLCRDEGTGECPHTTAVPDYFFDADVYLHHDVRRRGDEIFVLTARDVTVTDVADCDADTDVAESYPIIVDGLAAFDTSGAFVTQTLDYLLSDINGFPVDYATYPCGSPAYWGGRLSGADVLHTNSFWIDVADQWMFSVKKPSVVFSVDRELGSPTINDILWESHGDFAGGDFTAVAGGIDEVYSDQHTAHWGPGGELMLLDNGTAGAASRGLALEMDVGALTLEATYEYGVEDVSGTPAACPAGGSAFHTLGGNGVVTCPQTGPANGRFAIINEFAGSNSVVWGVELECTPTVDYDPAGIAFRGYPNPW